MVLACSNQSLDYCSGVVNVAGQSGIELARAAATEMLRNGPLALQEAKAAIETGCTQTSMYTAASSTNDCRT